MRYFKRGQVWIETVIYTLIALVLIGAILAFTLPEVEDIQDRTIIEQSITTMKNIDNAVSSVSIVPGNKRVLDLGIRKGTLIIDAENDTIKFEIETPYEYSEPGQEITEENIKILTTESASTNIISLTRDFSGYDLLYNNENQTRSFSQSSTSYKLSIENKGNSAIDFVVS